MKLPALNRILQTEATILFNVKQLNLEMRREKAYVWRHCI